MAIVTRYLGDKKNRVLLAVLLMASLLVFTGLYYALHVDRTYAAAAISSAKDTLNNSAPTATSNHTIVFTVNETVDAGETITVTFPSGFATTSGLDFNDFDLATSGGDSTLGNTASGQTWGATTSGDVVITFTSGAATIATGTEVTIEIGDNATADATGDSYLQNPAKSAGVGTADISTISIGGTNPNSGDVLVATIEAVTVSVTVDESLAFSIEGEAGATCDTKFGDINEITTTTSTVPFGTVTINTLYHGCQLLTISTNASSGYAVTAQSNTSLKETTTGGLINSGTCDGTCTETATDTWATATNNGWAHSSTGTDAFATVSSDDYRTFACTGATTTNCLPGGGEAAQNVMSNTGSVSNSTTSVEYRLSVSGTQPAGTYNSTVTYIATPTF